MSLTSTQVETLCDAGNVDDDAVTLEAPHPELAALNRWVVNRDEVAFASIVSSYERLVRHACRSVLGPGDDCEDATQETFIRLAQHADQVRSNLSAWLYACARSTAINMLTSLTARRRRENSVAAEAGLEQLRGHPEDADSDSMRQLEGQLAKLKPDDREVLLSYYCMGQTQEQIGSQLGISQVAAKKRIDRATERLRRRLGVRAASAAALLLLFAKGVETCEGPSLWPVLQARGLPAPTPATWLPKLALVGTAVLVLGLATWLWTDSPPTIPVPAQILPEPIPTVLVPAPVDPPAAAPVAISAPWGQGWALHEVTEKPGTNLDTTVRAPGIALTGWAHRPRPPGSLAIEARLRIKEGFCPYVFSWLGLCAANGTDFVSGPGVKGILMQTRQVDVGRWRNVRIEIGTSTDKGVPVAWIIDGKPIFSGVMRPESIEHIAVIASSGVVEVKDLRQVPLDPAPEKF